MNAVPPTWALTTIGEICDIVSGSTPKTSNPENWGGPIPWVTPDDLSGYTRKFIDRGRRSLTEKGHQSCSAQLVPIGTVLYTSRAPIGYVAIAAQPVCTNQGFKNFVPPNGVLSDYIFWYLKYATPEIRKMGSGTTFLEISKKRAESIPIPIAPTAEQRRIVAAIEEHFSRIDAGIEALQRTLRNLKHMRTAVLQAAMTGRLVPQDPRDEHAETLFTSDSVSTDSSLPRSWCLAPLSMLGNWRGGGTPAKGNAAFWSDGSIPWVSPKDMKQFVIRDAEDHITSEAVESSATRIVAEGSVLIVTRSGILRHSLPVAVNEIPVAINQDLKALELQDGVDPRYVAWALRRFEDDILHRCSKGGTTVQSIVLPWLLEFRIPVPPAAEQLRIVAAVEEQYSRLEAAQRTIDEALDRVRSLRATTLGHAFAGRLASQDSTDEPANVLLDRIKATREVKEPKSIPPASRRR
jgi:type I restriction enzyme S subunit